MPFNKTQLFFNEIQQTIYIGFNDGILNVTSFQWKIIGALNIFTNVKIIFILLASSKLLNIQFIMSVI